jgi:hypothetical protein
MEELPLMINIYQNVHNCNNKICGREKLCFLLQWNYSF